jgi:polyhydroxyalkanoate synthase
MMGWCRDGLLCLLDQGQVQHERILNIITIASPIDPESGSDHMGVMIGSKAQCSVWAESADWLAERSSL